MCTSKYFVCTYECTHRRAYIYMGILAIYTYTFAFLVVISMRVFLLFKNNKLISTFFHTAF